MIDKASAVENILRRLDALERGHALDVRSYKRDRSVVFVRTGDGQYLVLEHGFSVNRFEEVGGAGLKKLLKTLLRREFPRSHKLRVYDLGEWDEAAYRTAQRKVL